MENEAKVIEIARKILMNKMCSKVAGGCSLQDMIPHFDVLLSEKLELEQIFELTKIVEGM